MNVKMRCERKVCYGASPVHTNYFILDPLHSALLNLTNVCPPQPHSPTVWAAAAGDVPPQLLPRRLPCGIRDEADGVRGDGVRQKGV